MLRGRLPLSRLFVLAVGLGTARGAAALTEGKTAQGERFMSGRIALGEREALDKRRPDFSLWVVTAAKG